MDKKTYVVGKLSGAIAGERKIPLSAVTSGNGFVFVSGLTAGQPRHW